MSKGINQMNTKQLEKYVIQIKTDSRVPAYVHSLKLRSLSRTRWINEARKFDGEEAATTFRNNLLNTFMRLNFEIVKLPEVVKL